MPSLALHTDPARPPAPERALVARLRASTGSLWFWPVAVGVFAVLVNGAGMWVPSLWGDEAASIMSAQRPWPSLFEMLGHIDAVHGAYYVVLHVWIDVFGASTFSVRLPSVLAVGAAAAGVVVLVRRLGGDRLAVLAGVVFALLPRTSYMAAEARSYAISAAVAVWLTVLFVALVRRREKRWLPWAGYAIGVALGTYLFLYLALLALAHAVVLVQQRADRAVLGRWLASVAGAGVLALPVGVFAIAEREQIAFLGRRYEMTVERFFGEQWFGGNAVLAVLGWALVVAAVVAGVVALWRRAAARPLPDAQTAPVSVGRAKGGGAAPGDDTSETDLLTLAFAWLAAPTLALVVANHFVPLFTLRYTSFVAPALAIVIAVGIVAAARALAGLRVRRSGRPLRIGVVVAVLVAALVVSAAPTLVGQRGPFSKDDGSDWAQVAQIMRENARPGDAVAFTQRGRPSRSPRLAMHLYPDAFVGLRDVTLTSPYTRNRTIWDRTRTIAESSGALSGGNGRVWLVQYEGPYGSPAERRDQFIALQNQGYELVRTIHAHRDTVYLFEDARAAPHPTAFHDDGAPAPDVDG